MITSELLFFFSIRAHVKLRKNKHLCTQVIFFTKKSQENVLGTEWANLSVMPWKLLACGRTLWGLVKWNHHAQGYMNADSQLVGCQETTHRNALTQLVPKYIHFNHPTFVLNLVSE